jgi:hypothetical protein
VNDIDTDQPIPFDLTHKAIAGFEGMGVEVTDKSPDQELWAVTRVVLHIVDGVIPSLPSRIEPIYARHFQQARAEASRVLHIDPQDLELSLIVK